MYVGRIVILKNYETKQSFTFLYASLLNEGLLTIQGSTQCNTVVWP